MPLAARAMRQTALLGQVEKQTAERWARRRPAQLRREHVESL